MRSVEEAYHQFHLQLLQVFIGKIEQQPPFNDDSGTDEDKEFLHALKFLCQHPHQNPDFLQDGQQLLCKIVAGYPHITPLLYRDLLWFFGGDCLHFMPDEEIARFQLLDERRFQVTENGQPFSYEDERAKILGLH